MLNDVLIEQLKQSDKYAREKNKFDDSNISNATTQDFAEEIKNEFKRLQMLGLES